MGRFTSRIGILIAKVSNSNNYFQVGMSKTFQVADSGNLLLGMNDCTFFDNTGEVEIWITRYTNLVSQNKGIIPSISATQIPTDAPSFTPTSISIVMPLSTPTVIPVQTSKVQPTSILGVGSPQVSEIDGMVMRYVPAGPFKMGSNDGESDEKPANTVEIDSYWIDQTEVTIKMYALCVHSGVCNSPVNNSASPDIVNYYGNPKYDDYPVIQISWSQAKSYCEWAGRRLPSEKEWEKAARGRDARTYPWGNEVNGLYANYGQSNGNETGTMKVGSFRGIETPYEVYDMAGNVWEWVADWYDVYPQGDVNASSYFGESYRGVRGGAWNSFIQDVRSFSRDGRNPTIAFFDVGFRCALSNINLKK
jgi:formylglycine-generating enzyme required for sulfatase activity